MMNFRYLVLLTVAVHLWNTQWAQGQAADTPQSKTRIVFEPAQNTGLSSLLTDHRTALEKRKGAPLVGHEWWLWGLSAFDYDRDGDSDLLVCIHGSTHGALLKNQRRETGQLKFSEVTAELGVEGIIPSTDNYPLVWDFNGDGYLDIAGLLDDRSTPCLLNQAGRKFQKAVFSLHPINGLETLRDLNGDGYVDIRQTRRGRQVEFLFDPGTGSFKKSESDAVPPAGIPAAVSEEIARLKQQPDNRFLDIKYFSHDLNGDGLADLAIRGFGAYAGARLGWYLLAVDKDRFEDRTADLGLPREGAPMLLADVDQDGDVDVLVASSPRGGLYLNDGRGHFSLQSGPLTEFIRERCPYLQVAFPADLDNDGDLDLVVSNRRYGKQLALENLGQGKFEKVLEARGWDADPVVIRDMDGDGRLDLVIGGSDGKESIGIYLNKTPDAGRSVQLSLSMEGPNPYALGGTVELFRSGSLAESSPRVLRRDQPSPDGAPIHLGLGAEESFDLRVTFPGRPPLNLPKLAVQPKLQIDATGMVTPLP